MNDFTKKELIALEDAICEQILKYCPNQLDSSPLMLKLQFMIDNYCEHLSVGVYEERPHMKFTCMDCNKVIFGM